MSLQTEKELAAARALELVDDGMALGLGTGSTADCFIRLLGARVAAGLSVRGVPTSNRSARLAGSLGIALTDFSEVDSLDLAVDGTDEFDPDLNLIKGGGGALLREKIVAEAARRFVVICDASKRVKVLGRLPLPVEVAEFGWERTARRLAALGAAVTRRRDRGGVPFRTAQGQLLVDCEFGSIPEPARLQEAIRQIPGVVDQGLFVAMADAVIVASGEQTEVIESRSGAAC